ncbi:MAG: lysylphosphatidylglycerol synthase transmembrane domain-containing protein [Bacteroidia bacterium]
MKHLDTVQSLFSGRKLAIPILLGLAVSVYFMSKGDLIQSVTSIRLQNSNLSWLILALAMVLFRLFGYMYRLRILSDKDITWKASFQITALWEFASAVTPGIVGGTAVALGIISQEKKINFGRTTAIVMATSYLDALFYIVCIPVLIPFVGLASQIPENVGPFSGSTMLNYYLLVYSLLVVWTFLMHLGLFLKPRVVGSVIDSVFNLKFLKRWKKQASKWKGELLIASKELKNKGIWFWCKSFFATSVAWIARFALVNFLILALGNGSAVWAIFVKQLIMWGALMIPITPGSSGMAELLFSSFLMEYFQNGGIANTASIIWRLISFYPYILTGVIILPLWVSRIKK